MIQRLIKRLKESKGYTLTEMTAVVATAGVLTAVMLPVAVSQVQQARITAAAGEVVTIGSAIPKFLSDTSDYPMRSDDGSSFAERYAKTVLLSTDENGIEVEPAGLDTLFGGTAPASTVKDTFDPHFFTNSNDNSNTLYANWQQGRYLTQKKLDPWGNSYVIYLEAVFEAAHPIDDDHDGTTDKKILVLSAGPNSTIETVGTETSPDGDDIITVMGSGT